MSPGKPAPFWGVGPRIGLVAAGHFAVALGVDHLFAPRFRIRGLSPEAARSVAAMLIFAGVVCYFWTVLALRRARRENRLITTGPYRFIRHPLYAIGLFLLTPGVCILFRSWLVMTTPLAMAAAIGWFIRGEESELEAAYGQPYRDYRQRTGAVLPRWS
jgi:protein-S-isoprenylcysteine O-methyltransferase Ste14